jgi:putative DNA methylase
MWLWTLSAGAGGAAPTGDQPEGDDDAGGEDDPEAQTGTGRGGFALEYDAARKIAQGLGANLEDLRSLVEVKGDTATLLPVSDRARLLFGRSEEAPAAGKRKGKKKQLALTFDAVIDDAEEQGAWGTEGKPDPGSTVLDRVHQAMLLFAANRSDALKRFIADDGAGKDQRFWRLAQALSALYPAKSEERRWVDGVLARKRQLGF